MREFAVFLHCAKNRNKGSRAAKSANSLVDTSEKTKKLQFFCFATRFGKFCIFYLLRGPYFFVVTFLVCFCGSYLVRIFRIFPFVHVFVLLYLVCTVLLCIFSSLVLLCIFSDFLIFQKYKFSPILTCNYRNHNHPQPGSLEGTGFNWFRLK